MELLSFQKYGSVVLSCFVWVYWPNNDDSAMTKVFFWKTTTETLKQGIEKKENKIKQIPNSQFRAFSGAFNGIYSCFSERWENDTRHVLRKKALQDFYIAKIKFKKKRIRKWNDMNEKKYLMSTSKKINNYSI